MNADDFRDFGKSAVDWIANYNENLRDRDVLPSVKPGYLSKLLPKEAPEQPDDWKDIMEDIEKHIMPGITHWNSPNFHAFYPTANSYPAIVGELLCAGIGCVGLSWIASPACTELEMVTMDWLGKLLGLPEEFLNSHSGPGGGVIQGSASESTLIALMVARELAVKRMKKEHPEMDEGTIRSKLVTYTSNQSNSSVEKGGRLSAMPMRLLQVDDQCRLRGPTLLEQIEKDVAAGFVPCCVVATLGTTPTCAFDRLDELGPICQKYKLWLHVDAAYAGAAFVCPEYRHYMTGIEYVDSFNVNAHKWLLVNADCSALWVRNARHLNEALNIERIYLANVKDGPVYDYRHWQIPLGRRFRALKVWFVLRLYGVEGLQKHIRHTIKLAKHFEKLVVGDDRFEIAVKVRMGLICFRLKGSDDLTKQLIENLTARRKIYIIPGVYRDKLLIRFVVCSRFALQDDIEFAWNEISTQADKVLMEDNNQYAPAIKDYDASIKKCDDIMYRLKDFNLENEKQNLCS